MSAAFIAPSTQAGVVVFVVVVVVVVVVVLI